MRFSQAFFFGATLFLCQLSLPTTAQQKQASPKWEFKIVNYCVQADKTLDIQQLGEEGWELVNAAKEGVTDTSGGCQKFYFKRLKRSGAKSQVSPPTVSKPAGQCTLSIEKAPVIQGVYLRMSKGELTKLFSQSERSGGFQEQIYPKDWTADIAGSISVSTVQIAGDLSPNTSLNIGIFEDKVIRISAYYSFNSPWYLQNLWAWNRDSWKARISEAFSFQSNTWEELIEDGQRYDQMNCKGFSVRSSSSSPYSIQITDTVAIARASQARLDYSQKLQREFRP